MSCTLLLTGLRTAGAAERPDDPRKLIVTFSVSQWSCLPPAMERMAEVAHGVGAPVSWILNLDTAREEKPRLDEFHERFGDEVIMIRGDESLEDWRRVLPWARLNMVCGARPDAAVLERAAADGIRGIWGYCDQQVGIDGITHWGCPWGLFPLSRQVPFIPASAPSGVLGAPWTLRDLHKCYHLRNAINFGLDPIEMVRSQTLCRGADITFFQDVMDELLANLPWNDRLYCCLHEEAGGPFIPPGQAQSAEGASAEDAAAMYGMLAEWLRYAKARGATLTTLPAAVDEYHRRQGGGVMPSTLLTRDKMHGAIRWYADPIPRGVSHWGRGSAGHFPDTLFHFDDECQLVFVHPEMLPQQALDYRAQHVVAKDQPYPKVQVMPTLIDWQHRREGARRIYRYRLQSFYSLPFGLAEWGRFDGWKVAETTGLWARIVDDQVLLLRLNLEVNRLEHNQRWQEFTVTLVPEPPAGLPPEKSP